MRMTFGNIPKFGFFEFTNARIPLGNATNPIIDIVERLSTYPPKNQQLNYLRPNGIH
jgi:hypothetical protein